MSTYILPEVKVRNLSHIGIIQVVKQLQLWAESTPCRAQQHKRATKASNVGIIAEYLCYDVGIAVQVEVANDWLCEVKGQRVKGDTS